MKSSATILRPEFKNESQSGTEFLKFPRMVRHRKTARPKPLPKVNGLLLKSFTWYSRQYIRRHFHSLRISKDGMPPNATGFPLVLFSNHASWWDALTMLVIKDEFYPERTAFAPIDSTMLQKYRFFRRLGFFGVERNQLRGAVTFLRNAEAVLDSPRHLLALTPQSRFADVRERPVHFQSGIGHLATRTTTAMFVPVAAEYVFWEERLPEILLKFGEPIKIQPEHYGAFDASCWKALFEQRLTETQDSLAWAARNRDPGAFQIILRGGSGQGGVYDLWRLVKALIRREKFNKEHGTL